LRRDRFRRAAVGLRAAASPAGAAPPPSPPPTELALDASNYQRAWSLAFESANAGFGFAKLGADVADRLFDQPLLLRSLFRVRCQARRRSSSPIAIAMAG
jgi:hypothetical protein